MDATIDRNQNSYNYELYCGPSSNLDVVGTYSQDTGTADESIRVNRQYGVDPNSLNGVDAHWNCPHDPWIAPSAESCSLLGQPAFSGIRDVLDIHNIDFGERTQPFSTYYLNDEQRLEFFTAELQLATTVGDAERQRSAEAAKQAAIHAAFLATEVTSIAPSSAVLAAQQAGQGLSTQATFLATEVTPVTSTTNCASCSAVVRGTATPSLTPVAYHSPSIVAGWPQLSTFTQGEAVTSLQYLLLQSGATVSVDGKFGPSTDASVRAFQKAQGITADGIGVVGQQTWLALIVTVQQGSQGAVVKAVQSQLKSRNVAITVDGDFGSQTDAAVRTYQKAHAGLTVDGQVGPQTWKLLLAGS